MPGISTSITEGKVWSRREGAVPWPTCSEAPEKMSWAGLVTTSQKLRQPHKATEMGLRPREAWPGQHEGATEAVRQVQVTRKTREQGSVSSPWVRIWVREGIAWHKNCGLGRPWGHGLRLRTAPKHRAQKAPAFPMFHTDPPSQPEPRLGSSSTAQHSPALPGHQLQREQDL